MSLKCVNATSGLRLYNDGSAMLCCLSKENLTDKDGQLANIRKDSILDIMNGKKSIEIREALENGIRHPNCSRCWDEEDAGVASKRIRDNLKHNDIIDEFDLKLLELNLGTTCNLKCRICGPWSSSQWNKEYYNLGLWKGDKSKFKEWVSKFNHSYTDDSSIWEELKKNIHSIKQIDMYGGEPFMVGKQWEILQFSIDNGYSKNQILHFNTNGTHFDEEKIKIMKEFKEVYISISIDGIEKQFEYQRHPAKWDEVLNNLKKFKEIFDETPGWFLNVCITVNMHNILYLDNILNFFRNLEIDTYLNYLHESPAWNIKNLREDIKQVINKKYEGAKTHGDDLKKLKEATNFMNLSLSNKEHWDRFISFTASLDNNRNETFKDTFPEFYNLIYLNNKF